MCIELWIDICRYMCPHNQVLHPLYENKYDHLTGITGTPTHGQLSGPKHDCSFWRGLPKYDKMYLAWASAI